MPSETPPPSPCDELPTDELPSSASPRPHSRPLSPTPSFDPNPAFAPPRQRITDRFLPEVLGAEPDADVQNLPLLPHDSEPLPSGPPPEDSLPDAEVGSAILDAEPGPTIEFLPLDPTDQARLPGDLHDGPAPMPPSVTFGILGYGYPSDTPEEPPSTLSMPIKIVGALAVFSAALAAVYYSNPRTSHPASTQEHAFPSVQPLSHADVLLRNSPVLPEPESVTETRKQVAASAAVVVPVNAPAVTPSSPISSQGIPESIPDAALISAHLQSLQTILTNVDYKNGIHRNLVAGTVIVDSDLGRFSGVILDAQHVFVSAPVASASHPIRVMKYGAPYQMKVLNVKGHPFKVMTDDTNNLALLDFGTPVFPENVALPLADDFQVKIDQPLLVCGSPQGKEPRSRTGGVILEVLESGVFVLGVPGVAGNIGSPITTLDGKLIGVSVGAAGITDTFYRFKTPGSQREIATKALFVQPLSAANVTDIKKRFK